MVARLPKLAAMLALSAAACIGRTSPRTSVDPSQQPTKDPTQQPPAVTDTSAGDLAAPVDGYQLKTPSFTVNPGEEKFFCYYTSVPADADFGVKKYESAMATGSHHMIVYTTQTPAQPDGTLIDCADSNGGIGGAGQGQLPVWAFAAQSQHLEFPMPDGVGIALKAHQPVIFNMHYINTGTTPIDAHVTVNVEKYADGETFTPAAAFVTYNTEINIPPQGKQTVGGTCTVPQGAQFFALSTHSHKYTTEAQVTDGTTSILQTTDWEHPAAKGFPNPYLQFDSGKLTYSCSYENTTDNVLTVGESASKNEMCMAIGYYFPAKTSLLCLNSFVTKF